MSTLVICLPTDIIINHILSHLYPSDLIMCKEANPGMKSIIEENEEYIDTICQHIQPHGEYKWWHENGQLLSQKYYKEGKLHGEYKVWYENGQLKIQKFYKEGFSDGEDTSWWKNGQLSCQRYYKDGKLQF